jgi:hypothetical protein
VAGSSRPPEPPGHDVDLRKDEARQQDPSAHPEAEAIGVEICLLPGQERGVGIGIRERGARQAEQRMEGEGTAQQDDQKGQGTADRQGGLRSTVFGGPVLGGRSPWAQETQGMAAEVFQAASRS